MTTMHSTPAMTGGHETFTLVAKPRERTGSRHTRRIRQAGGLPAVLYGHQQQPMSLTLDAHHASRHILAGEKVFIVEIDGARENALLKDIQYDYLGTEIIHIDLERVDLDERVSTNLSLRFKGDAAGLKTSGAIFVAQTAEVEVECRVSDIMEHLDVDISAMEVGDVLHAGEVKLPESFTLLTDADSVLAMIKVTVEEEEPAEAAAAEGAAAEPEVLTEKKKTEEESD